MKKIATFLFFLIFTISILNYTAFAKDAPPNLTADNIVLMDGLTGEVLYSKNPNDAYAPASTTKTMTALLALENCKLDDKVKVGKTPAFEDGSKAGIRENEELTVKDLLYGLLYVSGNDCADALAEHVGGSIDNFVTMMNKRAKELGCENTHFVNPNGLYNPDHKTSAKDLALIMRELVKHSEYSQIATDNTTYNIISPTTPDVKHPVSNEIKMVWKNGRYYYDGIEGGKTGYTVQSLFSYVVSAKRNNQRLIVAMVHSKINNCYEDAINLLNYGFKNYELSKLYSKGDKVTEYKITDSLSIPLLAGEDVFYPKEKDNSEVPKLNVINKDLSEKSFNKGDTILEANMTFNDQSLGSLKLASGEDHVITPVSKVLNIKSSTENKLVSTLKLIFKIIGFIILGIVLIFAILILILRFKYKKKRNKYKLNSKYDRDYLNY